MSSFKDLKKKNLWSLTEHAYIYIYMYILSLKKKPKTGYFRIINLFPSCFAFLVLKELLPTLV